MSLKSAFIDEKQLLLRMQEGDERAFERLYSLYSNQIYGKLIKLAGMDSLADELLQDTFVTVWEKRHTINPELPFKPWIYRVAENTAYQFYRRLARDAKLQKHVVDHFKEQYSHTEEDFYLKESRQVLEKAIAQLSPQRRRVFELCRMEGKSYEEAAQILGLSISTVSNHLVKATELVRQYIFKTNQMSMVVIGAYYLLS